MTSAIVAPMPFAPWPDSAPESAMTVPAASPKPGLWRKGALMALSVAGLDQASKWWIVTSVMVPERQIEVTSFFNIVMVWNRGVTFGHLRRYDDALVDFNRAIELRPDDATTLMNRGNTFLGAQRFDEALTDYECSLELRPDDAMTLSNRAVAFQALGRPADARFMASIMIRSSMRLSEVGGQDEWMINVALPGMFSSISTSISPSMKRPTWAWASGV